MDNMPYIIAVDFDGTLCKECYPEIGEPNLEIIDELCRRQAQGTRIILWTCRAGSLLDDAIEWCEHYGLHFDAINDNVPETLHKYPYCSRKISADEYWDDKAREVRFTKS